MYNKEIIIRGHNLGYEYFIDYEHPLATGNSGRVMLHRHVASIKLGRWLSKEEHVHHIDANILNNSQDNLEVLTAKEHNLIHRVKTILTCKNCTKEYSVRSNNTEYYSVDCFNSHRVRDKTITRELLEGLIPNNSWVTLGKMFGYSDVGIKKRARALGCTIPIRKNRPT